MSETNAVATMLGRNTIGVVVVRKVGSGWQAAAEAAWHPSPIKGAPTITRQQLAQVLRSAADALDSGSLGDPA